MVVERCDVTLSDAVVLKQFIDEGYTELPRVEELHSGVDLECDTVYSMSPGQVILIGRSERYYNVIVKCDKQNCYNYAHLASVNVSVDDNVDMSTTIGQADKFVHFEHLTLQQGRWPVRVGLDTWYKHDPMNVLKNGYQSTLAHVVVDVGDDVDPNAAGVWQETQIWSFDDTDGGDDDYDV